MCVLALASTAANAEYTVKQYHDIRAAGGDAWNQLESYIVGFASGFNYADAMHASRHAPPLDCPLTDSHTGLVLCGYTGRDNPTKETTDTVAIETALAYAIPEAFPCNK